jgi:hypothetical protein
MEYIEAIPTLYNGIQYRSRLEARFAEWLDKQPVDFDYPSFVTFGENDYRPDFFIYELDLCIEIKPRELNHELEMFRRDIWNAPYPWMCVDQWERGQWTITATNGAFRKHVSFSGGNTFDFVIRPQGNLVLRVYAAFADFWQPLEP